MAVDLVVRNGVVVTSTQTFEGGVAVADGKIASVGRDADLPEGKRVVDVGGKYILPGLIDMHVHFREPGLTYKEDFATGSTAAVMGGVTTVLDMPNTKPVTGNPEIVAMREQLIAEKAYCDIVLVGVVVQENVDQIKPMAKAGVVGFKIFLGSTIGNIPAPDDGMLVDALREVADTGLRIGFHAENDQILKHLTKKLQAAGRTDPMAFLESRPAICEAESIQRMALFSTYTGARIHIYHLSSKDGAMMVREWRNKGVDITTETGPHYMFLHAEKYMNEKNVRMRMNPPVRTSEHGDYLYQSILDGTVNMIATDHSPHTPEEKLNPDIWKATSGFTGVETVMPLMLSEGVNKRGMSLNHFVKICSENPARVWDVWPRKGSLNVGTDADLTVVDLDLEWTVDENKLHSKNNVTPWHGWSGKGKPVMTFVRGNLMMKDGEFVAEKPVGQMVRPLI
jgi:dihydroorotase